MRKRYIVAGYIARFLMTLFWHYKVVNKEKLKDASGAIIASNHISYFDPPFIGAVTPFEIAYLAKSELFHLNRAFTFLIKQLNAIPIVRNSADIKGMNKIRQVLDSGKSLLMFPEGTRRGTSIKPGVGMFAMTMQKNILPVYIENADKPFSCMFFRKRTKIVIGDLIKHETFTDWEQNKSNYQKLAELVYDKIKELKKNA